MTPPVADGDTSTGPAIDATGVTVRYGSKVAVDNVDFAVDAGTVVGLIGPNGAGKTSLMECIEGLRSPAAGRIRVHGIDPAADRTTMARLAGVQLQDSAYPTRARVDEVCALFAGFYPKPLDWRELLDQFELTDKARAQVTKLSGGQRQRLSLVLALVGDPSMVFLDELTTGLDPEARRMVWDGLRRRNEAGLTVVLTSHHMDEIEYLCDRVNVMVDGRIVAAGTVSELIDAHAGGTERLVVDNPGTELRGALEKLGDVTVTPTGGRLRVEVRDAALSEAVAAAIAAADATGRAITATMDDVYVALTKQSVEEGDN